MNWFQRNGLWFKDDRDMEPFWIALIAMPVGQIYVVCLWIIYWLSHDYLL